MAQHSRSRSSTSDRLDFERSAFDIEEAGDYLVKIARPVDAQSVTEFLILGTCE